MAITQHSAATQAPDFTRLDGAWAIETNTVRYMSRDWTGQVVTGVDLSTGRWFWSTIEDAAFECGDTWSYVALA